MLVLGTRGRRFDPCCPDNKKINYMEQEQEQEQFKIDPPDFSEFAELYKNTMMGALDVMSTIVDDKKEKEDLIAEIQSNLDDTLKQLGAN